MWWTVAYIGSIVFVNWLFVVLPMWQLFGTQIEIPFASFIVGLIFIFRDFAQREIGHWVVLAMLLGGIISYWMADPFVAFASISAFLVSETIDWVVYSTVKKPFNQRMLLSSAFGTPVDSALFLGLIGAFSWVGVAVMTISKLLVAVILYRPLRVLR